MLQIKRFYESEEDFQRFYQSLRRVGCPHCMREGTLILHGYLYGYPDGSPDGRPEEDGHLRIVRGHRLFCSNRYRRCGCGKTVSVLAYTFLRGFVITAVSLWGFLANVAVRMPKLTAFEQIQSSLTSSAAYRLFMRVKHAQSRIRSFLIRHASVPGPPDTQTPLGATLDHLQTAFPDSACPIAAFQSTFQVSFL